MKRFIKRAGALMLAGIISAGMMLSASAKTFSDVATSGSYAEQIGILSDMGVIVGTGVDTNGNAVFSPDQAVTREQMALLMFRFMLNRNSAGNVNSSSFKDLYDNTYSGAISWANAAGYIIGTSATTYNPTGGITLRDCMTMIVRALGYGSTAMDKGYPWTYINTAIKLGLDNGLEDVAYTAELTRGQVAAMLYNALTADYLIPVSTGTITLTRTSTIIEEVYGYTISNSVLTATNNYTLTGSTVIKNGYVQFTDESGSNLIVNFAQTGLSGTPDQWLGHGVKLVYKNLNGAITVLGAFDSGKTVTVGTASVASDSSYVTINGVNYKVVSTKSSALSTNANELLVYAYDSDNTLTQVKTNAELAALLGCNAIVLQYDNKNSDVADRAIITSYSFGKLSISSNKINIAGNLTAAELTGGYTNTVGAVDGSYVLYYYNPTLKALTIAEKLVPTDFAYVTELTSSYAVIGGVKYTFGCTAAGVDPSAIKSSLAAGKLVSIVAKDGKILAVNGTTVASVDSTYLIATTTTVPVYLDGTVYYALTANINGSSVSILATRSDITANAVYRYVKSSAGIYTLIAAGEPSFAQNDDISVVASFENATTLSLKSNGSYKLDGTRFITDANTVIIVRNGSTFSIKTGAFSSDINIDASATVTAVFKNEVGSVETLKFMYITNGNLGEVDSSTAYVRILEQTGSVYVDGTVYSVYSVFNLSTGALESRKSLTSGLTAGSDYALNASGLILNVGGATVSTGTITGYTSGTVTIDNKVYTVTSSTAVKSIAADKTVSDVTIASLLNVNVQFVASGSVVKLIFVG
jgi:S-layer homology domain.